MAAHKENNGCVSRNTLIEIWNLLCSAATDKDVQAALKQVEALSPRIAANVKRNIGLLSRKNNRLAPA